MGRLQGRTISTSVAATMAGVTPDTFRAWAHQGLIPDGIVYRLTPRGNLRVNREKLLEWLDAAQKKPIWDGDQARLFHR